LRYQSAIIHESQFTNKYTAEPTRIALQVNGMELPFLASLRITD